MLCVIYLSSVNGQYCYNLILNTRGKKKVHIALLPESAFFKRIYICSKINPIWYQNPPWLINYPSATAIPCGKKIFAIFHLGNIYFVKLSYRTESKITLDQATATATTTTTTTTNITTTDYTLITNLMH